MKQSYYAFFNCICIPNVMAQVCAQRWSDLSEAGYGVSLLNDCKYGYATHGNVMRLSLLRSCTYFADT